MTLPAPATSPADETRRFQWPDGISCHIPPAQVLTAGYGNRPFSALLATAKRWNAWVMDIRLHPRSSRPEWCAGAMKSALKCRYIPAPMLGNLNHTAERRKLGIQIADADAGIALVAGMVAEGKLPLLLCACGDPANCHRAVVARLLEAEGFTTHDLTPLDWVEDTYNGRRYTR